MSDKIHQLMFELQKAHALSAMRDNISTQAVAMSAQGSHDFCKSVCAGIMMLGGKHAPLAETYDLLQSKDIVGEVCRILASGRKVPGWGNSFISGEDTNWIMVDNLLLEYPVYSKIKLATDEIHRKKGVAIHPNPSCYTAACGIVSGVPRELLPALFIAARLDAWGAIFMQYKDA